MPTHFLQAAGLKCRHFEITSGGLPLIEPHMKGYVGCNSREHRT